MQVETLKLNKENIGAIPLIDLILNKVKFREILSRYIAHEHYVDAIEVIIKNVLCDHTALYRINEWANDYSSDLVCGGKFTDDVIGRALDKLFSIDRSTLQTALVLSAIDCFNLKTNNLHNDSTSIKLHGQYTHNQKNKSIQPKL